MASCEASAHHPDSGEDQTAETDDRARIDGEGLEGCHQRGRPGEVHRPLGMGHARKRERKKRRPQRMCCAAKVVFGERLRQSSWQGGLSCEEE